MRPCGGKAGQRVLALITCNLSHLQGRSRTWEVWVLLDDWGLLLSLLPLSL